MSRRQQQGPPTDWVTRAADDALRHAHEGAHEGALVTCSSGASPSGPVHLGNLREFLTVHFVADELRAARHRRAAPARLGRLRPVPQGPGRCRRELGRPHRAPAERRPRPVGLPPVVGRALQGAAARRAARARRRHGARCRRPSATGPATTASRCCTPYATATRSTRCSPATAPRARRSPSWPSRSRRRPRSRSRSPTPTTTQRAARTSPGSRSSRTAAAAGATRSP